MADENLRPLIEAVDKKVDQLLEVLSPLPQQVADFRGAVEVRLEKSEERLDVQEGVIKAHTRRLKSLEKSA